MDAWDRLRGTLTRKRDLSLDKPKRTKSKERAGVVVTAEQVAIADIHQEEYIETTANLMDSVDNTVPDLSTNVTMKNLMDITDNTDPFLNGADAYVSPPEDSRNAQSRPQSSQSLAYRAYSDQLFDDPNIDATISNPWGRFMFPRHISGIMDRKKKFEIEEARAYCKEFNSTVTVTRADLEETINKKATDIAQALYTKMMAADHLGEADRERKRAADRHFSPYLTQAGIKVPEYFSPTATLKTDGTTSSRHSPLSNYLLEREDHPLMTFWRTAIQHKLT